jgi:hypothetical protein
MEVQVRVMLALAAFVAVPVQCELVRLKGEVVEDAAPRCVTYNGTWCKGFITYPVLQWPGDTFEAMDKDWQENVESIAQMSSPKCLAKSHVASCYDAYMPCTEHVEDGVRYALPSYPCRSACQSLCTLAHPSRQNRRATLYTH